MPNEKAVDAAFAEVYYFRREDNDEVIEVGFLEMMKMDAAGFIELEDGVMARRINRPSIEASKGNANNVTARVSDALGVPAHQVEEMRQNVEEHKIQGVEFVQEPGCPWFYQAHFASAGARDAYMAHQGMFDKGQTGSRVVLSEGLMEKARERVLKLDSEEKS